MITKDNAIKKIENLLLLVVPEEYCPVVIDDWTIEKEFGWVFFYQSKKYIDTNDFQYMLLGNAPYIVNRFDGTVHETGTANEIEYYIDKYEKKLSSMSCSHRIPHNNRR